MPNEHHDLRKLITIVMPEYNEEENVPLLHEAITRVTDGLQQYDFEFLLIDNCSEDDTRTESLRVLATDERWRYIRFSRNFGAEASLASSLEFANGDAIIFLQSDLQDPPELIPKLIAKWEDGYDVVYGIIAQRSDASFLKTAGSWAAYKLIHYLSEFRIPPNAGDFRLISNRVRDVLRRCPERNRYMRGLIHWVGFRQIGIPYERRPRLHGESSAGIRFSIDYALRGLFIFSTKPLRLASMMGIVVTLVSFVIMLAYIGLFALQQLGFSLFSPPPAGWMTLLCLMLFLFGMVFLLIGVHGEYIALIFDEVKGRPLWVVAEQEGFSPTSHDKRQDEAHGND
jgi:dolichol-phosphate mannosyltransferase